MTQYKGFTIKVERVGRGDYGFKAWVVGMESNYSLGGSTTEATNFLKQAIDLRPDIYSC